MRRAGLLTLSFVVVLTLVLAAPAQAKKKGSANGEIKAIDGRTLVLQVKKSEESFVLTPDTQYLRANEELSAGHFRVGDRVRVKYRLAEDEEAEAEEATAPEAEKIALRVELWIPPHELRRGGV